MAAVIKANCGPRHHAATLTESVDSALAKPQVHRAHEHHALHSGHEHTHASSDMAGFQDLTDRAASDGSQQSGHHYASYCSACAACCMGSVAPPVSFSVLSLPDNADVAAISPILSYLGFIPPSLDRPPKQFSA